VHLNSPDSM